MPSFRKLVDSHSYALAVLLPRVQAGLDLDRRLTRTERLAIGVAACRPTHVLTIHSKLERPEFMREFAKFKKRYRRDRYRPLIYIGKVAAGKGGGGYHVHLLLWQSLNYNALHGYVRGLTFGPPQVEQITLSEDPANLPLRVVAYVLGQEEPVFRSEEHARHRAHPKSAWRHIRPQRPTLERYQPKLLAALDIAESPAVPDGELWGRLSSL